MFDFPDTPLLDESVTTPDGIVYFWDGVKWSTVVSSSASFLPLAGGQMSGPLLLAADPTQPLEAASKQYTDQVPLLDGGAY